MKSDNSYRNILKGTSLFGGVQVFQIIVQLVRGKFVAFFLGPAGMGISALFNTASLTIQKFASVGLNLAVAKEVASSRGDDSKFRNTLGVARLLTYLTALLGALFCFIFAPQLSELTFGASNQTFGFRLLSVAVFFNIAGIGLMSILQGLHEVKRLSFTSLVGALAGLILGVPIYWYWGDAGIVPAIVLLAFSIYLFFLFSLRGAFKDLGNPLKEFRAEWKRHWPVAKTLLTLGIILMASDLIGSSLTYLLNIVIRKIGNMEEVGLFQAANSLTYQYSAAVFTAMAMDYFPRLSAAAESNRRVAVIANRQMEIVTLIISPVIALFILFSPIVIQLLLTEKFMQITELLRWMALGVFLKALNSPLGYITFAKDNKKVFFWLEGIVCNFLTYGLMMLGYALFGLIGIGYGMVLDQALCLAIYLIVNYKLYNYRLSIAALRYILTGALMCVVIFICSMVKNDIVSYSLMAVTTCATLYWSLRHLRTMLHR